MPVICSGDSRGNASDAVRFDPWDSWCIAHLQSELLPAHCDPSVRRTCGYVAEARPAIRAMATGRLYLDSLPLGGGAALGIAAALLLAGLVLTFRTQ